MFMRCPRLSLAIALFATCLAAFLLLAPAAALAGGSKVVARYNISFNGLSIGTFKFRSDWSARSYRLRAGAHISLLNGILFEWKARTESEGSLTDNGAKPRRYTFGYEAGDKAGSVDLRFQGSSVSQVNVDPPPGANRIPVESRHLRGVVDPLSAVIGLSNLRRPNLGRRSCEGRLRIFDGKMRYDLVLDYKSTRQVSSSGYSGRAFVCRVKFKPIAGHKASKKETNFLEDTDGIELWLIPVREAEMYVPYHIVLPLPVGSATITSEKFRVESTRVGKLTVIDSG